MSDHNLGYRLVFVHGAGHNASCWAAQLDFFKQGEAVTLPGHRFNEDSEGRNTIEAYASWLHDWLTSEYNDKVVLVGHSMGGAIALVYALMYPEHLVGLVLAGTGARLRVSQHIFDLIQKDYAAAVDFLIPNLYTANASDEMRQVSREVMLRMQPMVTLNDFIACNNYDVTGELGNLKKIPTLVITGSADVMTPTKLAISLTLNILGAELQIIDAAGHLLMIEKADEFNRLVDEFLATM